MPTTPDAVLTEEQRRAEEVYDRVVRQALRPEDEGKFVVVAFEADDFEVDADEYAAFRRIRTRHPAARLWLMRAGGAGVPNPPARCPLLRLRRGRFCRTDCQLAYCVQPGELLRWGGRPSRSKGMKAGGLCQSRSGIITSSAAERRAEGVAMSQVPGEGKTDGPDYLRHVSEQDKRDNRTYTVAAWMGIAIGGLICIFGCVLATLGLSSNIEWVVKATDFESKLKNAGPGVVFGLVGLFIMWRFRPDISSEHNITKGGYKTKTRR